DIDTLSKKIKNILGKMSLRRAKSVYVASQDHRRDLLKNLKISSEKIKVVHLAVNHRTLNQNSTSTDKRSNDFLFVSVIRPYKNLHSLVEAFGRLYRESPKKCPNLNIIGKPANYKNIEEYMQGIDDVIKEYGVGHKVFFLGAKTFDECMEYMSKCRAFIFPTLFEGFGLPLLEAMATHTPVLTSDKNSLPEIGGNTVMYMNAENVESIKNAMLDVIDNGYSQKLIENAFNRSKEFQWFKTASAIIKDVEYKV
ncbi:MAG: glycosyltransferase family 1 protein, partial [Colwellia sp.]